MAFYKNVITELNDKDGINSEISIYPNPANQSFSISSGSAKVISIEIYNIKGQLLSQKNFINYHFPLKLSTYPI